MRIESHFKNGEKDRKIHTVEGKKTLFKVNFEGLRIAKRIPLQREALTFNKFPSVSFLVEKLFFFPLFCMLWQLLLNQILLRNVFVFVKFLDLRWLFYPPSSYLFKLLVFLKSCQQFLSGM